jgi:hypothetical protein
LRDPILKKPTKKKKKKGLVEWLKVKALSSSPSIKKNILQNKQISKKQSKFSTATEELMQLFLKWIMVDIK